MPSPDGASRARISSFEQSHLTGVFDFKRDALGVVIDLDAHQGFEIGHGGETLGSMGILRAFGDYDFGLFRLQAGKILPGFGIYNKTKHLAPIWATVLLPQMYQTPANYNGDGVVAKILLPPAANLMIKGNYAWNKQVKLEWWAYVANGKPEDNGLDVNFDKGFGGRLRATLVENYKFGFSYCTIKNSDAVGRENLLGFDAVFDFPGLFKFEAEYAGNTFERRENRLSYYFRLTGHAGKFSPFLAYDYLKDEANVLFRGGEARLRSGNGLSSRGWCHPEAGKPLLSLAIAGVTADNQHGPRGCYICLLTAKID